MRHEVGRDADGSLRAAGDDPEGAARSPRGSRLAFAGALTALMLGTFASFGGLSYAASESASALHTIKKVTTAQKVVVHHSSANDQYPSQKQMLLPPPQPTSPPPSQGTSPASTTKVLQQSTLPFTGLSLFGTALVSGLLLLLGVALRRRERRSSS